MDIKQMFGFSFLKEVKWYEWVILGFFSIIQIVIAFVSGNDALSSIINFLVYIFGLLYVMIASFRSFWIFLIGFVQPILYAYVCYNAGLFGELAINLIYFAPIQIVGLVLWLKNINNDKKIQQKDKVDVKILSKKQILIGVPVYLVCWLSFTFILNLITTQNLAVLDGLTSSMCILGTLLLTLRYVENWLVYIIANVLGLILWIVTSFAGNLDGLSIASTFLAYLIVSVIGYLRWRKDFLNAKQDKIL